MIKMFQRRCLSPSAWPGLWAAEVGLARTRHTGEWRMSIENQLGFLIVVTTHPLVIIDI